MAIEPHQLAPNGHGHPSHGGNPNSMMGGDDDDGVVANVSQTLPSTTISFQLKFMHP